MYQNNQSQNLGVFQQQPLLHARSSFFWIALIIVILWLFFAFIFAFEVEGSSLSSLLKWMLYLMAIGSVFMLFYVYDMLKRQMHEITYLKSMLDSLYAKISNENQRGNNAAPLPTNQQLAELVTILKQNEAILEQIQKATSKDASSSPAQETHKSPPSSTLKNNISKDKKPVSKMIQSTASTASYTSPNDDHNASLVEKQKEQTKSHLTLVDFIQAADFPKSEHNQANFALLNVARQDPKTAKIMRATEDALTLLAQNGVYTESIKYKKPNAQPWRNLIKGERKTFIKNLAVVFDKKDLEKTVSQLKSNPIFQDTAYHFLRVFDKIFLEFEKEASDAEIIDFGNTHTSKTFVFLGQACGKFDL